MAGNPLGPGVSRYIDDRDRQYSMVVFQLGRPPLDNELNLVSLIDSEARAEEVRSRVPSGWLLNESNPRADFTTNSAYSNLFYFGRNESGETRNINWAVVNGWPVPVCGTKTGAPPLAPNNTDYWNKITLNPPSTSTGGNRAEFVFLEVWLARLDVDPPSPAIAPGKPQRGFVYKFGNVEGGFSYLPDEFIDPQMNVETTRRVQVQSRIRVVSDINLAQFPEGFDNSLVFAQGALSVPSSVSFANMRGVLGDPGLWRAGTGDPATFGTADGYVYAIPICAVFRRNAAGFSDIGNLAGSFNRNSVATSRTGATVFTSSLSLPGDLSETATSFDLSSLNGTVLATINNYGEAYFKIDDEIIRVNNVIANSPTSFTVTIDRGQLQTTVRSHKSGTAIVLYTVRPDGLYADQIATTDILDLRHSVADKFDYENILKTNIIELLKGNLRTTWKRYGSTNSAGAVVFYGDRITDSSIFVGGLTRLDAPDGNRRMFSDSVTLDRFNVAAAVPSNSASLNSNLQVAVSPYNINVVWENFPSLHGPGSRLSTGGYPTWWNGDQIRIPRSSFYAGMPASDSDQVKFLLPSDDADAVLIHFEGMTTDPNGGDPLGTTAPTASNPNLTTAIVGKRILKHGDGITVSTNSSGDLIIEFNSGTTNNELQEFIDALQGNTSTSYAQQLVMHIEFAVVYGPGRGLSHKPDYVHTAHYRGAPTNTSRVLLRGGIADRNRMIPTYFVDSPHIQTGNQRNLARTSELMVDPGSKTICVAPYRNLQVPSLLARNGTKLNWYSSGTLFQGAMPTLSQDGSTTTNTTVDPLDLFYNSTESRYVEVPLKHLPRPGLHHVPIQAVSNTVFSSGLNFLLMSKEGPNSNTSDYNINLVSYPNAAGYYIVTPLVGEVYGTSSGSLSIFGAKYTNNALRAATGGPFRGIKFPPFLAPARITGVYRRVGSQVTPTASPFDANRAFQGGTGKDVNLLRDSYDGPTILLDVDLNGDPYFVLNADAIDLTKAPSGTTFDNTEFMVECTLFGFDRGFLQTNGRILCAKLSGGGSQPIAVDTFTTSTDSKVGVIAPAPMSSGSTNNEVTLYYSRTPYQGDVFGSQSAFSDDVYRLGPLTTSESQTLAQHPLGPVSTLSLPNKSGYEVLSSMSFVTSLGTGRMSGSSPLPLLNTTEAPTNPPDYTGTLVDLNRRYSYNRIGYEDWFTPKFPVNAGTITTRPTLKPFALSEVFDQDIHPEFSGCVVHLPLGSYFRDKDFLGKTLYQSRSSNNTGAIPLGTLSFVPYQASSAKASAQSSTWEGTEFLVGNASGTAGVGTESIIRVDGTSNPADVTIFKTSRGGAGYSATGPWPGSVISSRFPKAKHDLDIGSALYVTAYLVRSAPENIGSAEIHQGHELQMIVVTQATPNYLRDSDIIHSASGINEGYTAVDRFRVIGRPLEKRRAKVDTTIVPADKPLFQNIITDNTLFFGSSDQVPVGQKQEVLPVTVNGQTSFTLSVRPLDPTAVQAYNNGTKLTYGLDYTVGGTNNQILTYIVNSSNPATLTTDELEVYYIKF